jgi:hypothetical protein
MLATGDPLAMDARARATERNISIADVMDMPPDADRLCVMPGCTRRRRVTSLVCYPCSTIPGWRDRVKPEFREAVKPRPPGRRPRSVEEQVAHYQEKLRARAAARSAFRRELETRGLVGPTAAAATAADPNTQRYEDLVIWTPDKFLAAVTHVVDRQALGNMIDALHSMPKLERPAVMDRFVQKWNDHATRDMTDHRGIAATVRLHPPLTIPQLESLAKHVSPAMARTLAGR